MRARPIFVAALSCAALLTGRDARAEGLSAVALNQFDPAPAGDVFAGVPSPFIGGHLLPRVRGIIDHAARPLVLSTDVASGDVVSQQTLLHIDASVSLWDRLLIDLLVPIVLAQSGDDPVVQGAKVASPSSASIGDMRLGVRLRPFGEDSSPFQLSVAGSVYAPTGGDGAYAGDGAFRLAPQLLLGGRINKVVWSAAFGAMLRASDNPSSITYGVSMAAVLLDNFLQVGPEVYGSTPLTGGLIPITGGRPIQRESTSNMELLLSARFRLFWGLSISAAAGPGLTDAIGTPSFRAIGGVGWTATPKGPGAIEAAPVPDVDADGALDAVDACPFAFGPKSADRKRSGCPVEDRDEDGAVDQEDACPDKQGDPSADPTKNGCPVDTDGDGVSDDDDACPAQKGSTDADPLKNGCSAVVADADGDAVPDSSDACPNEKGAAQKDAASSGCPALVRVKGSEIALLSPVAFGPPKGGKEAIDPASEPMLKEVVDVIAQHPEFVKIEVQGYTDNVGSVKFNESVSGARAELVRGWLVAHGAAADRIVSKGYGPASPIASNGTAEGRKTNRRVQIVVLETKKP